MAIVVAFLSQKGGVGKSTLARALAAVAAYAGITVGIADLNSGQNTVMRWQRARNDGGHVPNVAVRTFSSLDEALEWQDDLDLLIIDTPAGGHRGTIDIARHAHLVVQPTGASVDDLHPAVLLFHELVSAGIPKSRLVFAIMRTMTKREEDDACAYIASAAYDVLPGAIPENAIFRRAQNAGHALNETGKKTLNAHVDALMLALLARLTKEVKAQQRAHQARTKKGVA